MKNTVYDVIIIGAGPAGATLARLLGRSRSVLLLEERAFGPQGFTREKCCGGLLAPDAAHQLHRMGLQLPADVREMDQPLAVRALDLESGDTKRYPRPYVNLDRIAFEKWLVSLVPGDVDCVYGCQCKEIRRHDNLWTVTGKREGATERYTGRFLVGAEGAASLVRRTIDPNRSMNGLYFAVQDVFTAGDGERLTSGEYAAFFDPRVTDFYGWVIPKKDRVLLGAALPFHTSGASAVAERMALIRNALGGMGYTFDGPSRREGCLVRRPSRRDIFYGDKGAFLIGEAAGWISPSSAEGFSYAFASARALAGAILSGKEAEATLALYIRNTLPLLANIVWKTAKAPFMYTPFLRRMVMRSGLLSKDDA